MRYATIGTGWITDAFIEGAKIAGGLKLAAIYSSESTGSLCRKYGEVPVFTDLEKLAKSDIDAVYRKPEHIPLPAKQAVLKTESMSSAKTCNGNSGTDERTHRAVKAQRPCLYGSDYVRYLPARKPCITR